MPAPFDRHAGVPGSPAVADDAEELFVVPVSAVEHYSYCPRQCALIHIEQTFDENLYTIRGRAVHERVDAGDMTVDDGVRTVRGVPLWSDRLGLIGRADAVEMRPAGPYPVEYKSGRDRGRHAALQLCAQALCLEEMTGASIHRGALFHHAERRRREVVFSRALRADTTAAVSAIREMFVTRTLPLAVNDRRCRNCSLVEACMPIAVAGGDRLARLQRALFRPMNL